MISYSVEGGPDQPTLQVGPGSPSVLQGIQQPHEHIAGNILSHRLITDTVKDVTIDFREILIIDGPNHLLVEHSQAIKGACVVNLGHGEGSRFSIIRSVACSFIAVYHPDQRRIPIGVPYHYLLTSTSTDLLIITTAGVATISTARARVIIVITIVALTRA